ncbi:hypothetical protein MASR2M54_03170 [Aliarcobacter cryaerophilus]
MVVKTNGTKFFRYDFTFEKKRKSMSFGIYHSISLAKTEIQKDKAKELLKQNINPIVEKNSSNNVDETNIFKNIAEKWLSRMKMINLLTTFIKVVNVLENHAYPYIGNKIYKISQELIF